MTDKTASPAILSVAQFADALKDVLWIEGRYHATDVGPLIEHDTALRALATDLAGVLDVVRYADALPGWAHERGDYEKSIAELVREGVIKARAAGLLSGGGR